MREPSQPRTALSTRSSFINGPISSGGSLPLSVNQALVPYPSGAFCERVGLFSSDCSISANRRSPVLSSRPKPRCFCAAEWRDLHSSNFMPYPSRDRAERSHSSRDGKTLHSTLRWLPALIGPIELGNVPSVPVFQNRSAVGRKRVVGAP